MVSGGRGHCIFAAPSLSCTDMFRRVSRRDALKQLGFTGAGAALAGGILRGQRSDIIAGGRPVEIVVASLSASTVCIAVLPIDGDRSAALPSNGALADATAATFSARVRAAAEFKAIRAGDLVVRFTQGPPALVVETSRGTPVQRLTLNPDDPSVSFLLPRGPLLGLGEGGPQFDRKGSVDQMRNGQGGYQLRTHGGRAPVQWLIGTDGWGLFIHHPQGMFDFTGTEGRFVPYANGEPLDLFVVSSSDPAVLMAEYARITGLPELPALWTFGYMQSHRTLAGPDEIMWVARTFREKQLPCDALIYLGTEFTPSDGTRATGNSPGTAATFPIRRKRSTRCMTCTSRSCCTSSSKDAC
jgi:hypothetical protein